ncbi:polyprenyl synthetase family protein [Candidatus Woesearchaeota archaeon]|nr:polyprenyl synthetase family protein [Candidatus Woesearchaeota archaeon]
MDFKEQLGMYKEKINSVLDAFLNEKIESAQDKDLRFIYSSIKQVVMNGGKRLRPSLVVATYKALTGEETEEIYKTAICVELFHNYTLFHDDIMDEDFQRRGQANLNQIFSEHVFRKTTNKGKTGRIFKNEMSKYAVSQGIIAGNILNSLGLEVLVKSSYSPEQIKKAVEIYKTANVIVNQGQVKDIEFETAKDISEDDYMKMIEQKTAYLFTASLQIGAVLANATEEQYNALTKYGLNMGKSFQIQDDIMDVFIPEGKGNTPGSDICEGKTTLLIIKALENASEEQKKVLDSVVGKKDAMEEEIKEVTEIIKQTGALDYAEEIALTKIQESKEALRKGKINSEYLEGIADFMLSRKI